MQGVLDVTQYRIDPPEDGVTFAGRAAAGDQRDVCAIRSSTPGKQFNPSDTTAVPGTM